MSEWRIEIAQLPIVGSAGSHTFWVLRDPSGNTVREIQGFATGADGVAKTAGGPLTTDDTIRMHDLSRADLSRVDIRTALPSNRFMSEWYGADITSTTEFTGSQDAVMARWSRVAPAADILNRLGISYGPLTVGDNYNSNSVARYAGELMGLDSARPPNLVSGNPANAVGWRKDLMDRLIDGVVASINARQESLGRELTDDELNQYTNLIETISNVHGSCFGPDVPIDMWPLDPDLAPDPKRPDQIFDQDAVRSTVWHKPIEDVRPGDFVVSFDAAGRLFPRPVVRTFRNDAKILLDYFGTRVTPGHVYYRPDSQKVDPYETLIDILRDDGVILHQDGRWVRAATYAEVDSPQDRFVMAVAGRRRPDGSFEQFDEGRLRLGTRFLVGEGPDRTSWSIADLIDHAGGVVDADELIRVGTDAPVPFLWSFADRLPKPEDFVLACSGTTLEDIFRAAEWEDIGPRLPAPMVLDRGRVQPVDDATRHSMPRNEPLNVKHGGPPARRSH